MHDDADHTSGVCFPFFVVLQFGAFYICLVGEKNVRRNEENEFLDLEFFFCLGTIGNACC